MICKAIDNLPNYITISDVYIEHIPEIEMPFWKLSLNLLKKNLQLKDSKNSQNQLLIVLIQV